MRLIMQSILNTFDTLIWSMLLLATVIFMFALFFVMEIGNLINEKGGVPPEEESSLRLHFGSVEGAMLSLMYATNGGNDWKEYFEVFAPLGVPTQLLFVYYVFLVQIAFLNIILGIFVDRAMKTMATDGKERAKEHALEILDLERDVRDLLIQSEADGSGKISRADWNAALQEGHLTSYMDILGLSVKDLDDYFEHLANASKDGKVRVDRFIQGCMKGRGASSHLQVTMMRDEIRNLRDFHAEGVNCKEH